MIGGDSRRNSRQPRSCFREKRLRWRLRRCTAPSNLPSSSRLQPSCVFFQTVGDPRFLVFAVVCDSVHNAPPEDHAVGSALIASVLAPKGSRLSEKNTDLRFIRLTKKT